MLLFLSEVYSAYFSSSSFYLRSKQLFRPFPLKLFTDCVLAYKERLLHSQSQLKSILMSNPDLIPFSGSSVTETQRRIEVAIVKTLSVAIDSQIHLENDDFCGEASNEALLFEFNKVLNSLYFCLPLQLIWVRNATMNFTYSMQKLFTRERAPVGILQRVLILTRKILKKGYSNAEIIECGSTCWSKATSYPQTLIDNNVRAVFKITIPMVINTLLRAKNLGNSTTECTRYSDNDETLMENAFDPRTFTLNLIQLTAYVLATGCLSFSDNTLDNPSGSFRNECETFWSLVLGNIPRIPGADVETVCLLLDDISLQNISDYESDAGRIFPALIIVTTSLINCIEFSSTEDSDFGNKEIVMSLLFGLYKCVLRAGIRRFQQLPVIFAFECLATFAMVKRLEFQWSPICLQASELLIDVLIPQLSVQQTSLLLDLPGFPYLLLLGRPTWNALAKRMIYHCHSTENSAYLEQINKIPMNYELLSLIWSVWFPLLPNLEQQKVVRRLSETFENGWRIIERSKETPKSVTPENSEDERLSQSGGEKFALLVAEQFISLPTKLEVPASTLFYQSGPFRINLLRLLTLVVRLDKIFLNRLCLGRFIETVVSLLTDIRCEPSGNLLNLLRILNACLLMADEDGINQVTPYILERLTATKLPWLYARRPLLKMTNSPLMEELCVLGALLMFGEGPNKLYTTITPYRDNDNGGIFCPVFTISEVLLHCIRGGTVAMVSQRACCSAALLLIYAPNGLQMGPWPSYEESPKFNFYLKLQASVYSNLLDPTLKPFQILLSSLLGRMLKQCSQEALDQKVPKRGALFGETIWNQLVLENLLLEEVDENDELPYSMSLLAFLAELLANTPKLLITSLVPQLLQDLVVFYAQQPADPIPPGSPYALLQKIVDVLSKNEAVTFLTNTSRKAIREKLHMEGYAPQEPILPSLGTYRRFLLPELSTTF
ncbi:unnamed protein product [Rodentolepis nana]|uniref:Uncharacterized protein n=1 Tax=Rodentolepis nana TaxID=102285 RepID=A0A0R3TM49_RODNA|nr:unnamed protein product [Rodentolepis nana]